MKSDFARFQPYEFRLFSDENGEPKIIEIQDPNQDLDSTNKCNSFLTGKKVVS